MGGKDSSSVNQKLTSKDKWLLAYTNLVFIMGILGTLFVVGSGAYALWDANHNNNLIQNEIAFLQKTVHDDGLCITIDTHLKNIFANCPVVSNTILYKQAVVTPTNVLNCSSTILEQNNENIRLNFQSGVHVPGIDFSMLVNPNTASANQLTSTGSQVSFFNEIDISNKFVIKNAGSLIFGDTGTISAEFPINDDGGSNFGDARKFRNYNHFFVGSFDYNSMSSDRCNANMNLVGPSIYILLNININDTQFCLCIPKSPGVVQEFCTSSLKLVGGISSATS